MCCKRGLDGWDGSARPPQQSQEEAWTTVNKQEEFELCARRLKALADPTRLRLITCLFKGPKNVGDLAAELNDEVVTVSHHLGVLRKTGLVQAHRSGRHVEYALHPDVSRAPERNELPNQIELGCCRLDLDET